MPKLRLEDRADRIQAALQRGLSYRAIARREGVSHMTVTRFVTRQIATGAMPMDGAVADLIALILAFLQARGGSLMLGPEQHRVIYQFVALVVGWISGATVDAASSPSP